MYAGGDLENWYRERGIRTLNFNMQGPLRGWLDLFALRSILRLLRGERIDLVHTHLLRADIYGRAAAALSGIPSARAERGSAGPESRTTGFTRSLQREAVCVDTSLVGRVHTTEGRRMPYTLRQASSSLFIGML